MPKNMHKIFHICIKYVFSENHLYFIMLFLTSICYLFRVICDKFVFSWWNLHKTLYFLNYFAFCVVIYENNVVQKNKNIGYDICFLSNMTHKICIKHNLYDEICFISSD